MPDRCTCPVFQPPAHPAHRWCWAHGWIPDLKAPSPRAAGEPVAAPVSTRSVRTGRGELDGLGIAELLARAVPLGYVEQPAPNGGVRSMRLRNFLRNKVKQ